VRHYARKVSQKRSRGGASSLLWRWESIREKSGKCREDGRVALRSSRRPVGGLESLNAISVTKEEEWSSRVSKGSEDAKRHVSFVDGPGFATAIGEVLTREKPWRFVRRGGDGRTRFRRGIKRKKNALQRKCTEVLYAN